MYKCHLGIRRRTCRVFELVLGYIESGDIFMNTFHRSNNSEVLMKAFNNSCEALKLGVKERALLLGVNRVTLTRNVHKGFSPESKAWELQLHFIRLYRSLYAIAGGDPEFMTHWFYTENNALNGVPALICLKIEGLFRTNQYLDAMQGKV
jgi:hypothetical protein